jgi:hypothetical protein
VNTASSLILIRVSFLTSTTVVAGVNALLPLLSLTTEAVLSALPLPLADIMIVCICPVALYT